MKVSIASVQRAIDQHYRNNTTQHPDHSAVMGHEKLVMLLRVLNLLEAMPGFTAAEVLAVAHLAAQNQISEDSR